MSLNLASRGKVMPKTLKNVFIVMVSLSLMTVTGCAKKKICHTGFFEECPDFKPGPKGGADYVYFKDNVDFKAYDKVMVNYVEFYFTEDAEYKGIHPLEMELLANTFHQKILEALKGSYPVVSEAGPGVLQLRVALSDLAPSRSDFITMTEVLSSGTRLKKGSIAIHTFIGGASIEVEMLDSQTSERLAAAVDTKSVTKHQIMIGKWEHVEDAFGFWSKRLRIFLDNAHGKKEVMEKALGPAR
jgi:hypothetical protein